MKMANGHCIALKIFSSKNGTARFSCSVYDRRPEICRALERGSPECLADLETKGNSVAAQIRSDF